MSKKIRVTIWNEFVDEKYNPEILDLYQGGVHEYLKSRLVDCEDMEISVHTLDEEDQGLSDETIENTDVLVWYSHMCQDIIDPKRLDKIAYRVLHDGMGVIFLHSALYSGLASKLIGVMGTGAYREEEELERVFLVDRSHPIADGLPEYFEFPESEMYAESDGIPTPDELVFISWYEGGNASRSGLAYKRGAGKLFCFTPGHAWYDVMLHEPYIQVVKNAIRWAVPPKRPAVIVEGRIDSIQSPFRSPKE